MEAAVARDANMKFKHKGLQALFDMDDARRVRAS